ncbi:MAG: transposase domain-containing protein, partial [Gallionella sp.]
CQYYLVTTQRTEKRPLHHDNSQQRRGFGCFAVSTKWRELQFSDTPAGANASAIIYSLLQTAKANGIEPYTWLRRALRDLPAAKTLEEFESLLPWNLHALDLTSEMAS